MAAKKKVAEVAKPIMGEAIRELVEQGVSIDSLKFTIEEALKSAYKRKFGTVDNCIVKFEDDMSDVSVYSRKTIVDGEYDPSTPDLDDVWDPATEISLGKAKTLTDECDIGDEIDIRVNIDEFERSAITIGKQFAHQGLRESLKNTLYDEYKNRIGTIVTGKYQREKNGNIYLDIDSGKIEGVLPLKFQNPREDYYREELIKGIAVELKRLGSSVQLVISRTDPNFVRSILENEVPELKDGTVEIFKIVRDAGYRTKLAVSSTLSEVDPVGACVGQKGQRIQKVIMELDGEKIDVLRYDSDPTVFIKNALSPAEVSKVLILDEDKKQALAIVPDSQFSLAIGKQGQNVKLANKLCDWSIDVKTEAQAAEMDLSEIVSRKAASLFSDAPSEEQEIDEISTISDLSGVDQNVAAVLKEAGFDDIQDFVDAYESGELFNLEGVTKEQIEAVNEIVSENVEFVDEDESEDESEEADVSESEEEYTCPECGTPITLGMTRCPNPKCNCEFEFEEDEE